MDKRKIRIDLFVEDEHHEMFCQPIIRRFAKNFSLVPIIKPVNVRGGHGRALSELRAFQQALEKNRLPGGMPDLLLVVIDANCLGHQEAKRKIQESIKVNLFPHIVIGCPDPHVERWYLTDLEALEHIFKITPQLPPYKCDRKYYKHELTMLIKGAGFLATQGGSEFGPEIVEAMNLQKCLSSNAEPSLGSFIKDIRNEIKRIADENIA